jgi:hypothetical protein
LLEQKERKQHKTSTCWNKKKGSNTQQAFAGTKRKEVTQNKHLLEQKEKK